MKSLKLVSGFLKANKNNLTFKPRFFSTQNKFPFSSQTKLLADDDISSKNLAPRSAYENNSKHPGNFQYWYDYADYLFATENEDLLLKLYKDKLVTMRGSLKNGKIHFQAIENNMLELFKAVINDAAELGILDSLLLSENRAGFNIVEQLWIRPHSKRFIDLVALKASTSMHGFMDEFLKSGKKLSKDQLINLVRNCAHIYEIYVGTRFDKLLKNVTPKEQIEVLQAYYRAHIAPYNLKDAKTAMDVYRCYDSNVCCYSNGINPPEFVKARDFALVLEKAKLTENDVFYPSNIECSAFGYSLFHVMIITQNYDAIDFFMQNAHPAVLKQHSVANESSLFLAAVMGNWSLVRELQSMGMNMFAKTSYGMTPCDVVAIAAKNNSSLHSILNNTLTPVKSDITLNMLNNLMNNAPGQAPQTMAVKDYPVIVPQSMKGNGRPDTDPYLLNPKHSPLAKASDLDLD